MTNIIQIFVTNLILQQIIFPLLTPKVQAKTEADIAREFLTAYNENLHEQNVKLTAAEFEYFSKGTDATIQRFNKTTNEVMQENRKRAKDIMKQKWMNVSNLDTFSRRAFKLFTFMGENALPEGQLNELNDIINEMTTIYETAEIPHFFGKKYTSLKISNRIVEAMESPKDTEEVKHIWVQFRNSISRKLNALYPSYVDLMNLAALCNRVENAQKMWFFDYDGGDIKAQLQKAVEITRPLYLQIHGYIRKCLMRIFPDEVIEAAPIPAHLLGSISGSTWEVFKKLCMPYRQFEPFNYTDSINAYSGLHIFKKAETFYESLGLRPMPKKFWTTSVLDKSGGKEYIMCNPTAWDFHDGQDYRVILCTRKDKTFLLAAHKLLAEIHYFMSYKDLPEIFQYPGNAFLGAVGDAMILSVDNSEYFELIGLPRTKEQYENHINNLFSKALSVVVNLPFAFSVDFWRWDVFSGSIKPDKYNCKYWQIKHHYEGVDPPVNRTSKDFDMGGCLHVPSNIPYVHHLVSTIVKYQIFKSLCRVAKEYDPFNSKSKPLHKCHLYGKSNIGEVLLGMMSLGRSKPWHDVLEVVTGSKKVDAGPLMEYFNPLLEFLVNYNKNNGVNIGWERSTKRCT